MEKVHINKEDACKFEKEPFEIVKLERNAKPEDGVPSDYKNY